MIETPHGRCAIIELADDQVDAAFSALPEAERAAADKLAGIRRRDFIAGRTALHAALGEPATILADDRGAPVIARDWVGSISHKGTRAAGLVARAGDGFVGIDLERAVASRFDIGRRVLTANEQGVTGPMVTLYFAIKEAIYKAIDPIVRRYVGFSEVELEVGEPGPCAIHVIDPARLPVAVEAWWRELDGHWLATARGRRR